MSDRIDNALGSVLDARSHNLDQHTRLFDDSPEIDSAIERAVALAGRYGHDPLIHELVDDLTHLHRSNAAEAGCERDAAGLLDQVLRGAGQRALGVKSFARAARPLLRNLDQPGATPTAGGILAARALRKLIAENPEPITRASLVNELGIEPHRRLTTYIADLKAAR